MMPPLRLVAAAATLVVLAPAAARAQKDLASCQPLVDAMAKGATVPSHAYVTATTGLSRETPRSSELITTGGVSYVMTNGTWRRSPITPAALQRQARENLSDAKVLTCRHVRDDVVDGTAATVYRVHSVSEVTEDGEIWIARGTGLMLRADLNVDTGDGAATASHIATRYVYTGVRAPADVR